MRPCASVAGTRCTRCDAALVLEPAVGAAALDDRRDLLDAADARLREVDDLDPPAAAARRSGCTCGRARRRTARPRRRRCRRGSRARCCARRSGPWARARACSSARAPSRCAPRARRAPPRPARELVVRRGRARAAPAASASCRLDRRVARGRARPRARSRRAPCGLAHGLGVARAPRIGEPGGELVVRRFDFGAVVRSWSASRPRRSSRRRNDKASAGAAPRPSGGGAGASSCGGRLGGSCAYRFLKRSTRPAVSISFCLPVKNGWHALQISRRSSFFVEWVSKVLPQAQTAVTRWSSGGCRASQFRPFYKPEGNPCLGPKGRSPPKGPLRIAASQPPCNQGRPGCCGLVLRLRQARWAAPHYPRPSPWARCAPCGGAPSAHRQGMIAHR